MTAVLSDCGTYRYRLDRTWDVDNPVRVAWIMLNPSTADATVDDPTIRRCIGFSKAWGAGGLTVVNVFALRATDPRALARALNPVGPDNDAYVQRALSEALLVVAAWGQSFPRVYAAPVERMARLARASGAHHLGLTRSGQPMHPLYRPAISALTLWEQP